MPEKGQSSGLSLRVRGDDIPAALLFLILICVVIEGVLTAGDFNVFGTARLRHLAYEMGGFWPGLLQDWKSNYPSQPVLMFFTYGFLHGGLLHLAVNMFTLYSLGRAVIDRVGQLRFLVLYLGTVLGGAWGFGMLADTLQPMVGASGALFGLAGALISWNYVDRFIFHRRLWPIVRVVIYLILLNIVLWYVMGGQLAWQTHLGGFVAGWVLAMIIDPRGRKADA
ncbi:Rhomboid protease GluP [Actibacterium lipolyticum]|uniref:Rhomboid protease GluP n=2 Tax=Actibacterium lipolyticum TaxID=1524263 RepID=A0A238KUS9_9RHOB|nr:Rhomboid protease GluP [Actibacterium lipolyticum]